MRSQADGSHFTSTGELPLILGIDGIGHGSGGKLRYFVLDDTPMGSIAEETVIEVDRSIVLPCGVDPAAVVAGLNSAIGSWLALPRSVQEATEGTHPGSTGNASSMAMQVAR